MKTLSDYKGEDALTLWADLIGPMARILGDEKTKKAFSTGNAIIISKCMLEDHKKEACEIMLRVDPTPIDGLNIVSRLLGIILEILNREDMRGFFVSAGQEQTENVSFGSAMENIKVIEET